MRLIDADPIMLDLELWMEGPTIDPDVADVVDHMGGIIRTAPTIDAEPTRFGEWIKYGRGIRCSECDMYYVRLIPRKYCSNCGAKMQNNER